MKKTFKHFVNEKNPNERFIRLIESVVDSGMNSNYFVKNILKPILNRNTTNSIHQINENLSLLIETTLKPVVEDPPGDEFVFGLDIDDAVKYLGINKDELINSVKKRKINVLNKIFDDDDNDYHYDDSIFSREELKLYKLKQIYGENLSDVLFDRPDASKYIKSKNLNDDILNSIKPAAYFDNTPYYSKADVENAIAPTKQSDEKQKPKESKNRIEEVLEIFENIKKTIRTVFEKIQGDIKSQIATTYKRDKDFPMYARALDHLLKSIDKYIFNYKPNFKQATGEEISKIEDETKKLQGELSKFHSLSVTTPASVTTPKIGLSKQQYDAITRTDNLRKKSSRDLSTGLSNPNPRSFSTYLSRRDDDSDYDDDDVIDAEYEILTPKTNRDLPSLPYKAPQPAKQGELFGNLDDVRNEPKPKNNRKRKPKDSSARAKTAQTTRLANELAARNEEAYRFYRSLKNPQLKSKFVRLSPEHQDIIAKRGSFFTNESYNFQNWIQKKLGEL